MRVLTVLALLSVRSFILSSEISCHADIVFGIHTAIVFEIWMMAVHIRGYA